MFFLDIAKASVWHKGLFLNCDNFEFMFHSLIGFLIICPTENTESHSYIQWGSLGVDHTLSVVLCLIIPEGLQTNDGCTKLT